MTPNAILAYGLLIVFITIYTLITLTSTIYISYFSKEFRTDELSRTTLYSLIIVNSIIGLLTCMLAGVVSFFQKKNVFFGNEMLVFYIVWFFFTYLIQIYQGYASENTCGTQGRKKDEIFHEWKIGRHGGETIDVWQQYEILKKEVEDFKKMMTDDELSTRCEGNERACKKIINAIGKCNDTKSFTDAGSPGEVCTGLAAIHKKLIEVTSINDQVNSSSHPARPDSLFPKSLMSIAYNIDRSIGSSSNVSHHRLAVILHNSLLFFAILGITGIFGKATQLFMDFDFFSFRDEYLLRLVKPNENLKSSSGDMDKLKMKIKEVVEQQGLPKDFGSFEELPSKNVLDPIVKKVASNNSVMQDDVKLGELIANVYSDFVTKKLPAVTQK